MVRDDDHRVDRVGMQRRRRLAEADDDVLLGWTREGDQQAFEELYRRNHAAVHAFARRLSRRHLNQDAAEDLVAEAVRKILDALAHGQGPTSGFRLYLFASVRSVAYTRSSRAVMATRGTLTNGHAEAADARIESSSVIDAFNALPARWRQVLWATAVLGYAPRDLAERSGLTPNNIAALSARARDGLRVAYLRAQLPVGATSSCAATLDALVRTTARDRSRQARGIADHLDQCADCTAAAQLCADLTGAMHHERLHIERAAS